jgi:hypothetical protein
MKKVLIKPLWPDGLGGRVFDAAYPWTFQKWRDAALELGILMDGWDMHPLETADCVWFLDLSDTRKEYEIARKTARKGVPFVLHVMETPAGRSQNFHPKNQALFDFLITYQQHLTPKPNIYTYRLPHSLGGYHSEHKPFENRKCAVMVNSNRTEGWLAPRRPGIVGLPGIGPNLSGWHRPWWAWILPAKGELYSWRRRFARLSAQKFPGSLDIYGPGWNGNKISWNPMFNRVSYPNCVANGTNKKLDVISNYRFTISVENFKGSEDYISEKIFDPLIAGSVPVYLGDKNIDKVIPDGVFVDVRNFSTQSELLQYLNNVSKEDWGVYYNKGQEFLKSEKAKDFSTDVFIQKMNEILLKILKLH